MKTSFILRKPIVLWSIAALLVLGLIVIWVAISNRTTEKSSAEDAEAMAKELRANGAIVENYYKVIGKSEPKQ